MKSEKFEDTLRAKFEEQTIQPSSDAWNRLEKELNRREPASRRKIYYYAAAAIAGVLIISNILFFGSEKASPQVVVEDSVTPSGEFVTELAGSSEQEEVKEISVSEKSKTEIAVLPEIEEKKTVNSEVSKVTPNITPEDEAFLNKWAEEIAASLKTIPDSSDEQLLAEVDNLLTNARREQFPQRISKDRNINATALLEEVEWELDRTFKEKIFDFLGDGYDRIKTAVSLKLD